MTNFWNKTVNLQLFSDKFFTKFLYFRSNAIVVET
jgi:hypothetical protein